MPVENKGLFMRAEPARTSDGHAPTFSPGRACEAQRCRTRLSVYNPADVCWQQEGVRSHYFRANGRRRRIEEGLVRTAAG